MALPNQLINHYRHHRHPSNASESSANSLSIENNSYSNQQDNGHPNPSTTFVDEPLPMEGDFATMDLHSSPSQINGFLPNSTDQQHQSTFRYDTLTWAKEHPSFPEPQDTILATAGIYPKSSNLTSILDQPDRSISTSDSPRSNYLNPQQHSSLDENTPQITITTQTIPSNPTSPLLRLNMNHPAMPTGPSISLTSATPLTAKPNQQIPNLFDSINDQSLAGSTHHHNLTDPSQSDNNINHHHHHQNPTDELLQSFINSTNNNHHNSSSSSSSNNNNNHTNNLFQSLLTHPRSTSQNSQQHNLFLSPRPIRARQRSKSESMGNHQSPLIGTNSSKPFFSLNPPTTCPPPITQFFPISPQSNPVPQHPTTASSSSSPSSEFWTTLQTGRQPALSSQLLQATSDTSSCALDGQGQIIQQLADSSYLQGLLEEFNVKKPVDPESAGPFQSMLRPTSQLHHRRSHSVSHPAGHRRGRSEGLIAAPMATPFNSFIPQLISSGPSSQAYPNGLTPHTPSLAAQQGLFLSDSSWSAGFPLERPSPYPSPFPGPSQAAPSPATSEACFPQYSSRPRSYSHSSFESEDTAGSVPNQSFLPMEFRSKTTAATKAAAIRRRKVGVAARYICEMCGESFTRRYNLRGHQRAHKGEKPFACGYPGCTSRFARAHDQKRHYKLHLGVKDYSCPVCRKTFIRLDALQRHHKSDAGQACFQELQQLSSTLIGAASGTETSSNNGAGTTGSVEEHSEFDNSGSFDSSIIPSSSNPVDHDETPESATFNEHFAFHQAHPHSQQQQQQQHLLSQQHNLDHLLDHTLEYHLDHQQQVQLSQHLDHHHHQQQQTQHDQRDANNHTLDSSSSDFFNCLSSGQ